MAMGRLVLIDGSALAYRSYFAFAKNPLVTSRGENTSAVFGFANSLLKIREENPPDYLAIFFDTSAPTFRHELYGEYKSTRAKMPDELGQSLPRIHELVEAMRIAVVSIDGIEADDAIGTLATRAERDGLDVLIVSGDKDFCQLITPRVKMLRATRTGAEELIDVKAVERWMGVGPERIIDLLALMGDTSDNIPGVPGVGKKTAIKLLETYDTAEGVLAHAEEIRGKLGERVREHADAVRLSRDLVTIRTDLTLDVRIDRLVPGEPDRARLSALFRELEFQKLAERFAIKGPEKPDAYRCVRTLEELDALVARLRDAELVAFDTETTSLAPLDAELVGMSFSPAEGEAWYVPLGHRAITDGNANLPLDEALARIRPILEDPDVPKVGQHVKYDASVLLNHGIEVRGVDFDTMLAAYLLDPGRGKYGIDTLALEELGRTVTTYGELVGKGKDRKEIWEVGVDRVAPYACEDADVTLRLRNRYAPRLEELALRPLFDDVEMPLSDVLMRMERRGIAIDRGLFSRLSREMSGEMHALEASIHELAGHAFTVNSPQQLRGVLFEELGLPVGRRTKTGASTDSDVLEKLADVHPIARKILDYRQVSKLLSTYVDALPRLVREDTGRIHTSYHQTVAATGRLSSSDPNLQNIPIRTEAGRKIRAGFIAREGWRLLSADYSQVELRILASITRDSGLLAAFREGVDVHRHTAAAVFAVEAAEVTPEMRAKAKAVNFGVIYGQGARALAATLAIPVAEAEAFISAYFERYASVRAFKEETLERARREGFVTTLMGRRRYLPDIGSSHGQRRSYAERMAVNTVIQGTAADLIKVAMVSLDRRMQTEALRSAMLLQVHDELLFEAVPDELEPLEAMVREEMSGALDLAVPLVVEMGSGRDWLEAH
jgi:DNA polymerase-1